jgi:hypothetical protein
LSVTNEKAFRKFSGTSVVWPSFFSHPCCHMPDRVIGDMATNSEVKEWHLFQTDVLRKISISYIRSDVRN